MIKCENHSRVEAIGGNSSISFITSSRTMTTITLVNDWMQIHKTWLFAVHDSLWPQGVAEGLEREEPYKKYKAQQFWVLSLLRREVFWWQWLLLARLNHTRNTRHKRQRIQVLNSLRPLGSPRLISLRMGWVKNTITAKKRQLPNLSCQFIRLPFPVLLATNNFAD